MKVKIGWKYYEIINKEMDSDLIKDGQECFGRIDFDKQVIYLNSAYSKEQREATLIHEILHGIDNLYQIDLSEKQVALLADGLYTVIKDNGGLINGSNASNENDTYILRGIN